MENNKSFVERRCEYPDEESERKKQGRTENHRRPKQGRYGERENRSDNSVDDVLQDLPLPRFPRPRRVVRLEFLLK